MPSWAAPFLPCVALVFTVWLAYWSIQSGSWVSDDCAFSGPEAKPISLYDGTPQKPFSWHTLFKRLRYFYGRVPNPNPRWQEEKQPPYLPSSRAHHRLNLVVFSGVVLLFYSFLCRLFDPHLAFLASLLFAVHPLGCQAIGWISGIGYPTGTLFMLAGLNSLFLVHDAHWLQTPLGVLGSLLLYTFFQWMAVEAWFGTVGIVAILLWMKAYPFAIIAALFALYQCFHTFKEALDLRKRVFKEQQMDQSTKFYPRKLVVVLKTLYYNTKLMIFPKRMGLYHPFCYHYDLPYVEAEDRYFWFGLLLAIGYGVAIWRGPAVVSFGLLWMVAFLFLFLNWITANQFVVDRYVWLPSAGACLVVAASCPLWAYWTIFGIALMRLWAHHDTYRDEFAFYHSNLMNFPTSEVAWGNLGVAYLQRGEIGAAMDAWSAGIRLNPQYDVCWYNLASMFLQRGPVNPNYAPRLFSEILPRDLVEQALTKDPARSHLHVARFLMAKALESKTCHFPKVWKEEYARLENTLSTPLGKVFRPAVLIHPLLTAALT